MIEHIAYYSFLSEQMAWDLSQVIAKLQSCQELQAVPCTELITRDLLITHDLHRT